MPRAGRCAPVSKIIGIEEKRRGVEALGRAMIGRPDDFERKGDEV